MENISDIESPINIFKYFGLHFFSFKLKAHENKKFIFRSLLSLVIVGFFVTFQIISTYNFSIILHEHVIRDWKSWVDFYFASLTAATVCVSVFVSYLKRKEMSEFFRHFDVAHSIFLVHFRNKMGHKRLKSVMLKCVWLHLLFYCLLKGYQCYRHLTVSETFYDSLYSFGFSVTPFYIHLISLRFNFYVRIINRNLETLKNAVAHFETPVNTSSKLDAFEQIFGKVQKMGNLIGGTLTSSILLVEMIVFSKLAWRGYKVCMMISGKCDETLWGELNLAYNS